MSAKGSRAMQSVTLPPSPKPLPKLVSRSPSNGLRRIMIVLSTFGISSHEHWFRLLGNGSLKHVCALDSRRSNGLSFLHHVFVITKTIISRVDFIP